MLLELVAVMNQWMVEKHQLLEFHLLSWLWWEEFVVKLHPLLLPLQLLLD